MEAGTLPRHWLLRALDLEPKPEEDPAQMSREAIRAYREAVEEAWKPGTDPQVAAAQLESYAQRLRQARPGDTLLACALQRALRKLPEGCEAVRSSLRESLDRAQAADDTLLCQAETLFRPSTRALTLGCDSRIRKLLLRCGPLLESVTVAEGRPDGSGVRLAEALGAQTIPVRLVTEAELELVAPECDLAVVSAERVLPSGDVVATVGTAVLARVCAGHQVPFYVLAERDRWVPEGMDLAHFAWERRPPAAVLSQPPCGVQVLNVAYDLTPAALVTGYVVETGIITTPLAAELRPAA
jgi:methylthioribose-1-phosphate isomerase